MLRSVHPGRHVVKSRTSPSGLETACVESRIQEKLASIQFIRDFDAKWSEGVHAGQIEYSKVLAKQIQGLYEQWMRDTKEILAQIADLQRQGRTVRGGESFCDAVGFCPAGIDVDATASAFTKLENGEGIPLTGAGNGKISRRRPA